MSGQESYPFTSARAPQDVRLAALEELLDAGTIALLEARGVGPGWRCLEVGAGSGSIAAWLCDRVGPTGSVVAADLDVSSLRGLARPNLSVQVHDVERDDLPDGWFHLIHLRLLLAWLGDPGTALRRLVAALKPGGRLLAEEMDFVSAVPDPRVAADARATFERVAAAKNEVLAAQHTFDPFYGRRLAGDLDDAGLAEVGATGRAAMWRGGQAGGTVWRLTLEQLRAPIIASGLVSEPDVERAIALCRDPGFSFLSQITMAAWGARPAPDD